MNRAIIEQQRDQVYALWNTKDVGGNSINQGSILQFDLLESADQANAVKCIIKKCGPCTVPANEFETLLSAVEELTVEETNLQTGWLDVVQKCVHTKSLTMQSVNPPEAVAAILATLKELRSLNLHSVAMLTFPSEFHELKNLEHLDVASSRVSDIPEPIIYGLKTLFVQQSQVRTLPMPTHKLTKLEELNISATSIVSIPDEYYSETLTDLSIGQRPIDTIPSEIVRLPRLRSLSLAGTRIAKLPAKVSFVHTLESLDICYTSITQLPAWIAKATNLKSLGLSELELETLSSDMIRLFLRKEIPFLDELPPPEVSKAKAGVYIHHLYIKDMDTRLLRGDVTDREFLRYYLQAEKLVSHNLQVLVYGASSGKNRQLMLDLLDIPTDGDIQKTGGFEKIDRAMLIDNDGRLLHDNDAQIGFWLFADDDVYQAAHPLFLGDNNLYVIFLSAGQQETLGARALQWARLIELHSPWSQVLFVITHAIYQSDWHFLCQLPAIHSVSMKIDHFVLYDDALDKLEQPSYDKQVEDLRKQLATIMTAAPGYNWMIPRAWRTLERLFRDILNATGIVTASQYDDAFTRMYVNDPHLRKTRKNDDLFSNKMLAWLNDSKLCIQGPSEEGKQSNPSSSRTTTTLFTPTRIATPLYAALAYARTQHGRINEPAFWEWLIQQDSDTPFLPTRNDAKAALQLLSDKGLCYRLGDSYFFPLYNRIPKASEASVIKWMKAGTDPSLYSIRYIVRFDYLSHAILSAIIAKIWEEFYKSWGGESIENTPEVKRIFDKSFFCSTEGAIFAFPPNEDYRGGMLYIGGMPGVGGEVTILASEYMLNEYKSQPGVQSEHLKKYCTYALDAIQYVYKGFRGYHIHIHYTAYVCYRSGDQTVLISLHEIEGNESAGRKELYIGTLRVTENISELVRRFLPKP